MNSPDFVSIEVELLLAKYGKDRVLRALADAQHLHPEAILESIGRLKNIPRAEKKALPNIDLIIETAIGSPTQHRLLQSLLSSFRNKTLFPQLRDVQDFMSRKGDKRRLFKSRNEAAAPLFRFLLTLNINELQRLESLAQSSARGDLHTLAQGILNRKD